MKRECYSLGGLKGQTKEAPGVGSGRPSKLLRILSTGRGDLREGVRYPRRLIPLSPVRNRREVRRIGLDQQTISRHEPEKIVVRPLLEGHDPAKRNVPAGVDGHLRERVGARVAVQNANDARSPCVTNYRARVVLRIAGVDDYRTLGFSGEGDLG